MTFSLLSWFARWVSEGNDPALEERVERYEYRHGTKYEQHKAVASARKARTQSATGRTFERARPEPLRRVQ